MDVALPDSHDRTSATITRTSISFRSPRVAVAAALSSATPLALLLFNRDWMFTTEGYLDPWHYVGLFREYLNPSYSPGAYKLARLPWVLAGFVAHHLFSPVPAAYVLHGSFLIITSLALFAGLYALFGRVSLAAVVATMLGFYTHAHGSGGWDYHNTAAGAFYLLTFMLLALPGSLSGRRLWLVAAGAAAALAIHSNITLVNFLPALIFVHLQTVRVNAGQWPGPRRLLTRFAWSALGALLITAALGLINLLAGREFFFFAVLARITAQYVSDPRLVQGWWAKPGWELTAIHLALPAAVFLLAAASLAIHWRSTRHGPQRIARSLLLQFLIMSLVWIGWEKAGELALSWNYFAYPLIPSCFVAIGGLLAIGWPDTLDRHWFAATFVTAALALLFLVGLADSSLETLRLSVATKIAAVGCVVFVVGLAAYVVRPTVVSAVVAILVFAVGNRFVSTGPSAYLARDPCKIQEAVYSAIVETASAMGALDSTYTRVRTWFDQQEEIHPTSQCVVNLGSMSGSISTMGFFEYVTTPWPMPKVDAVPDMAVHSVASSNAILAIITAKPENLDAWTRRMARMNLEHREIASIPIRLLDSTFSIHAWELFQRAPSTDFGAPLIAVTDQTSREVNVYGTPKGTVVEERGRFVFKPTDPGDHVSYAFKMFQPRETDAWARVTTEFPPSTAKMSTCRLVVQNPGMVVLARLPCETSTRYVAVPAHTPGLRVFLNDPARRPIVIPRRIEVALSK
jgi:hypothetical protein